MATQHTSRPLINTLRTATRATRQAWQRRTYQSYDFTPPPPFPPAEVKILSAAYAHIPSHGFTLDALKLGARDAGYLDVSTNLFPRGAFDLVNYHLVTQRLGLKDQMQFPGSVKQGKRMGVGEKVRALTLARLRANEPVVHRWQEALAIMAQPKYIPTSLAELARLADEIWFLAGDGSVDASWYTKRATLSAIYSASEVFMTQDRSKDFTETEQFLDQRLEDLRTVGGFMGGLLEWLEYTRHSGVNVLRSKGVKI